MTHRRVPQAHRVAAWLAARGPRAAAVAMLTVPIMLLAHLLTTNAVPGIVAIILLTGTVLAVTAATGTAGRWRLALVVGSAQFAGHALLATLQPASGSAPGAPGGCLPVVGRGAALGLQLALLRHDAACPQGSLTTGPTATAAVAAVLAACLIVAGHTLVAVLAAVLVTAAAAALNALRACATLTLVRVPPAAVPIASPRAVTAAPAAHRTLRALWSPRPAHRRGPPPLVMPA